MNKSYTCLHAHSDSSLLDGLSKPTTLASRYKEIGSTAGGISDHGTLSNSIKFLQAMKDEDLKPILGEEFYISKEDSSIKTKENSKLAHMCVYANGLEGWKDLVQASSMSNLPDNHYHKPRLDLDKLGQFSSRGNLMAFSGHIGSHMSNVLFNEDGDLKSDWKKDGVHLAEKLHGMFGKDNFFLEVQLMDSEAFPKQKVIAECIREISKHTKIPLIATCDAHYARKEDAEDQRVLICSNLRTTMQKARLPDFGMSGFFRSSQYHIPSYEDMVKWHTQEELDNTNLFAARIGPYGGILRKPQLPQFQCPDGHNAESFLLHLCREGWKSKIIGKIDKSRHQEYADRVKFEIDVINRAGLASYFLIVWDILNYCRKNGQLLGLGRGSVSGSLVAYLLSITGIDSIKYDLIFERFYNDARNTKDFVSMPDVDMDVPNNFRDCVIEYVKNKYGHSNVGQMVTFQTMKGRGAIKDVLRAYGGISFEEMNDITKNIIEEHKISDELEKMKEETGESSIIRWCLENRAAKLKDWCYIDDNDNLGGPLANRFAQAIRLEGTKVARSRHPAGVVISPEPLNEFYPMVLSEGHTIVDLEMNDLEACGGLKLDVLGLSLLQKAMGVMKDLEFGEI